MSISDGSFASYMESFRAFDKNGDCSLDRGELLELWSKISDEHSAEVVNQQVDEFMDKCDKDKNGFITYNEFFSAQKELQGVSIWNDEDFQKLFRALSGFLAKKNSEQAAIIQEHEQNYQKLKEQFEAMAQQEIETKRQLQEKDAEVEAEKARLQQEKEEVERLGVNLEEEKKRIQGNAKPSGEKLGGHDDLDRLKKELNERENHIKQLAQNLQRVNGQKERIEKDTQKLGAELEAAKKRAQECEEAAIEISDKKDKEINELRAKVEELEERHVDGDEEQLQENDKLWENKLKSQQGEIGNLTESLEAKEAELKHYQEREGSLIQEKCKTDQQLEANGDQIAELLCDLEEKEKELQEKNQKLEETENILRDEIERRDKLEKEIRRLSTASSPHKHMLVVSTLLVLILAMLSMVLVKVS